MDSNKASLFEYEPPVESSRLHAAHLMMCVQGTPAATAALSIQQPTHDQQQQQQQPQQQQQHALLLLASAQGVPCWQKHQVPLLLTLPLAYWALLPLLQGSVQAAAS
jgi:hypothetical protein